MPKIWQRHDPRGNGEGFLNPLKQDFLQGRMPRLIAWK